MCKKRCNFSAKLQSPGQSHMYSTCHVIDGDESIVLHLNHVTAIRHKDAHIPYANIYPNLQL